MRPKLRTLHEARRIGSWRRHAPALALWLTLAAAAAGAAQIGPPDTAARLREIAACRDAARRPGSTPAERQDALNRTIVARAALIDAAEKDDRAPTWMLDQAVDLLERAGRDGAEASVIFGVPTPEQTRRVRDAAAEAGRLVRRADELASGIVGRLQDAIFAADRRDPGAVQDAARTAEATLSVLVDTEQAWRIGLLRARVAVLVASTDGPSGASTSRVAPLTAAVSALHRMVIPGRLPETEIDRRLTLGAARLLLRSLRNDGAGPEPDPAADFRWVLERLDRRDGRAAAADIGAGRASYLRIQAASGIVLSSRTAQQAEESCDALLIVPDPAQEHRASAPSPAAVLLGGEARARALLLTRWPTGAGPARSTPQQNAVWTNHALAGLVAALEFPPSPEVKQAWERLVYTKLAAVVDPSMPLDRVTPHAAFARALHLGARDLEPGEDLASRLRRHAEASRLLRLVESRADAGALRAEALWETASLSTPDDAEAAARMSPEQRIETATMLMRLVSDYPDSRRTRDAIETAVWATRLPASPDPSVRHAPRLRELQVSSREKALALVPPAPDDLLCRLELGRLLAERAVDGSLASPVALADLRRATELLAQAAADPSLAPLADREMSRLFDRLFDPAAPVVLSSADRVACAQAAVDWAARRAPDRRPLYQLVLAESCLATDAPQAKAIFADLIARLEPAAMERLPPAEQAVLRSGSARIRLGAGRARRATGEFKAAFEILRGLADELDHDPVRRTSESPELTRPAEFWGAWTELVEMLAADNPQGGRTSTIRLHLNRLALIDRDLGPEPYATRLRKIKASLE